MVSLILFLPCYLLLVWISVYCCTFVSMKYTVTSKDVTVEASVLIDRYRDVERIGTFCRQCPVYGQSWGCPPFDFDPCTATDGFKTVLLMGTTIEFDEATRAACTSAEKSSATGREAMEQVCQTVLPRMYEMERQTPGSRCFTFRCSMCPEGCTRPDGKPCRHPEQLRHSLESVGFDIVGMTRDLLGIDLEWSADGSLPKHLTLITALFLP